MLFNLRAGRCKTSIRVYRLLSLRWALLQREEKADRPTATGSSLLCIPRRHSQAKSDSIPFSNYSSFRIFIAFISESASILGLLLLSRRESEIDDYSILLLVFLKFSW